jgi:hypothetical protein
MEMGRMVLWHVVKGKKWVMNIEDFVKQHVRTLSIRWRLLVAWHVLGLASWTWMKWNLDKINVNIKDLYHESFSLSLHGKQRGIVHSCH